MASKIDFMLAPPAMVLKELGIRLAQSRLQQNITQDELAQRSGIAVRTLRRFEAGHGGTAENLIRLLQALDLQRKCLFQKCLWAVCNNNRQASELQDLCKVQYAPLWH